MPFFGGGVKADNIPDIVRRFGTDVGLIIGHGVYAHPESIEAGARSIVQSWESLREGVSLKEYAKSHKELEVALTHWRS